MKKYDDFINEAEMMFSDIDISKIKPINKKDLDLEELSMLEIGKQGRLAEYIKQGNKLKFGMLKALYHDAIVYKRKREYQKGVAKFALRAIPLAMAPIFFPIWLISQILGATRAVNKIIVPSLKVSSNNYNNFLKNLIIKTMTVAEGDIKPLLGNDWYYDVFFVSDGLVKMVRKEHIYEFALFISNEIEKKDDNLTVPPYWLDNQFRKWLNDKFDLDLPTGERLLRHKQG